MSDKTEAPTARRLLRARREGDVAISSTLVQTLGLGIAVVLAPSAVRAIVARCSALFAAILLPAPPDSSFPTIIPTQVLRETVALSAPILIAVASTVVLVGLVQTRALIAPQRIMPDLRRLSPMSLFRSLTSTQRMFAIVRGLLAMAMIGWLVVHRLQQHMPDIVHTTGRTALASIVAGQLAGSIARDVVVVMLALAVLDLWVTHRSWLSRLRMTRQEVKREHRESEGDPQLKAARERAHREMFASAVTQAVRDATVVIISPGRFANALRYREDADEAPVLVASGEGDLARRIVEAARIYQIPVVCDVPVAQALAELGQGGAIPASLYEAVAIILRDLQRSDETQP